MGERRRALVAGVTSCGGRHLAAALDATAWDVVGTRRPEGAPTDGLPPTLRVATHTAGDSAGLRALLDEVRPSAVYFLLSAGRADSFETMFAVTVRGVAALCEALLASRARPVVVVASSSAVYGTRSRPERVNESAPRRPTGPYGLGKSIAEEICDYHARRYALPIRIARPFNHPGPGERVMCCLSCGARKAGRRCRRTCSCAAQRTLAISWTSVTSLADTCGSRNADETAKLTISAPARARG